MRKTTAALLTGCIIFASLVSGCSKETETADSGLYGKAANEIYTYEKVDEKKTQIVVGVQENDDITAVVKAFSVAYPDVQPFILYMQKGDTTYAPGADWVKHGYSPDIVYNIDFGSKASKYLVDLSAKDVTASYYKSALDANDVGGHLYCLPGPMKVMCVAYNKTLFSTYGWSIPKTFGEFVTLCDRITADTGGKVRPYNANGKYYTDFSGGMEGFIYGSLLSGVNNHTWYNGLINGKKTFSGHMEPYFDMIKTMADHGILRAGDLNYSYTTRAKEFNSGKIAMINEFADIDFTNDHGYQFGYMPFPALSGSGQYLSTRQSYNLSVIKKSRTKAQEKAVDEYLKFVSTPKVQALCMNDGLMLSSVKKTAVSTDDLYQPLQDAIKNGRYFKRLDYTGGKVPDTFTVLSAMRDAAFNIVSGKTDAAGAAAALDTALAAVIASPPASPVSAAVGTAAKNFTVLETSEYIADAFRRTTGADIALVPDNAVYRGNLHRIFAGSVTESMLSNMTPRSLDNGSKLVKVKMTGANLIRALNSPMDYSGNTGSCIYAFSGLKAKAAPWNKAGSKYLSVTLADGSSIDPTATYTVAFWQGMVREEYVSSVVQSYDKTYQAVLKDVIKSDGTIKPADDGRLTLIWN